MRFIMFFMRTFGARGRLLMNLGTALGTWLGASSVYALEPLDQGAGTARTPGCLEGCLVAQRARGSRAPGKNEHDDDVEGDEQGRKAEPALTL